MTEVYKYYKEVKNGTYKLEVITRSKEQFKKEMFWRIRSQEVSYDPCCNYPCIEKQIEMLERDIDEGRKYFQHFSNGYAEYVPLSIKAPEERKMYLDGCLVEHYEEAISLGYEVFAIVLQGSQNYGVDLYTEEYCSDVDTKCIILPSPEDVIRGAKPISETYERANKEHIDIKDIRSMFECFRKQNVNYIEILFSDFYIVPGIYRQYWEELQDLAETLVHAHPAQLLKTMSGMSMEKLKALKHPYPSLLDKIEKFGYDPKQAHTIVRMNDFMHRYIYGLDFKQAMCTSPYLTSKLIDLKLGKYSLEAVETLCKDIDAETKQLKDTYIKEKGDVIEHPEAYEKLEQIKVDVLIDYFKRALVRG